jgi:phosphoglycolate phosphatase
MQTFPIAGIVFDFDGTLAKLNIDFAAMRREVLALAADYGIAAVELEGLYVLEAIEAAKVILARKGNRFQDRFHDEACALISGIELRAAAEGSLLAGTREMMADLRIRGVKSGIITRNCRQAVTVIFPDIADRCDAFIPRGQTRHVKPHPEHLHAILRLMDVPSELAVMVGDHPLDIKAGKNAGVRTAGVLTGSSSRQALVEAGADYILSSAPQVLSICPPMFRMSEPKENGPDHPS